MVQDIAAADPTAIIRTPVDIIEGLLAHRRLRLFRGNFEFQEMIFDPSRYTPLSPQSPKPMLTLLVPSTEAQTMSCSGASGAK